MQQVNFLKIVITFLFTITLSSQVFAAQWGSETGQYVTDKADRVDRIEHPAVDTFSMIDFLMCITNIRPDLYPNSNFKALVDEGACEAISGNADPSSTVTKYAELWNSCTRASNTAPQICKGWFLASDGAKYLAEVTATTAPTDARPNGEFTMTYCKANEASGECPVLASSEGRGQLSVSVDTSGASDVTVFQLIDAYVDEQAGALTEKLYASSSDHKLQTMTGATLSYDWSGGGMPTQKRYEINFDGTYALVKEGSNADACYPMSSYTEYPRQYSLYSLTDGSEKTMGGGIQFEVATVSGSNATVGERGYMNYWGAHVDRDSYLVDGDTITATSANSTLGIAENDIISINLADGVMRERNQFSGTLPATETQASGAPHQTSTLRRWINGTETNVYINTTDKTVIKATSACFADDTGSGCNVTSDVTWDGASTIGNNNFDVRSDRVGGWIRITDATTMAYIGRTDVRVGPGSVTTDHTYTNDLYLKCYGSHCRFPTQDGSTLSTSGYSKTYFDQRTTADNDGNTSKSDKYIDPSNGSHTPVYYKLEADDMILYRCPASTWNGSICTGTTFYPVICDPSDSNCSQTSYDNVSNMWQGNLVKATETINGWSDIDSKTEWQWNATNHVRWDKGAFPKKGTEFIIFEKPLEFAYTHSVADDRNGATPPSSRYTLVYEGAGELHGFDWVQQSDGDYYPSISIKDGTLVDIDMDGTDDHAILARQVKLVPTADGDTSNCISRSLSVTANGTTLPDLPDINAVITHKWAETTDGTYTFISDSPCVVDGVQQTVTGCQ